MAGNQSADLGNSPGSRRELKRKLKPCCRHTESFTAGKRRERRTWQSWRKQTRGPPFPPCLSGAGSASIRVQAGIAVWQCGLASVHNQDKNVADELRGKGRILWHKTRLFQWPCCPFESNCFPGQSVPTGHLNAFSTVQYSEIKWTTFHEICLQ